MGDGAEALRLERSWGRRSNDHITTPNVNAGRPAQPLSYTMLTERLRGSWPISTDWLSMQAIRDHHSAAEVASGAERRADLLLMPPDPRRKPLTV